MRTAAAKALGELKDERALWVIVATLKLRDETTAERQAELEKLRQAASAAWRKIGDPLGKGGAALEMSEAALAQKLQDARDQDVHPRLTGDLSYETPEALIEVLKELIAASEEVSWAKLENREPMLAGYFRTYDQRHAVAGKVGTELARKLGRDGVARVLETDLKGHAAIRNWWMAAGIVGGGPT